MLPFSEPILVFTILSFIILVSPIVAERFGIPDIVILILAGILIGPHAFYILERDSAVTLFGSVGLLYIMFLAGLEIDLHSFSKAIKNTVVLGVLTFIIPQVLGTLVGIYILGFGWLPSILLASMFASHTLLSYPIAVRLGITKTQPVFIATGATIITDTLALLVLAIIANYSRGESLGIELWGEIFIGMAVLILLICYGIPYLARWFFSNVSESGGGQFLFVLTTLAFCSYFSYHAKMEPIIGAFLAGAAFNRLIPEQSVLMNRVRFTGNAIFIPFFLISVGMLVKPIALVQDYRTWGVSLAMIITVIATKYSAAWLSSKIYGYNKNARNVIFGLTVVQAAATLAAVLVAYDLGIFDETVLNGAIAMIVVTCPLGAWCVDFYGKLMAEEIQTSEKPEHNEQRLLVAVANPKTAVSILNLAFLLRDISRRGAINVITLVREDDKVEESVARGERLLTLCISHANSADIPVIPSVRVNSNVADGIIRAAKGLRASHLLIGWNSKGRTQSMIFGSLMEKLLDECPLRIIFCRLPRAINLTRRILLLLPPGFERERDLPVIIRNVKFLSKQISAEIVVYIASQRVNALREELRSAKPSRPLSFIETASLSEAREKLIQDILPEDLIFLLGERKKSILWMPNLDRIASIIAAKFPENNILLTYPSLAKFANETEFDEGLSGAIYFTPMKITTCELEDNCGIDAAINLMVRKSIVSDLNTQTEAFRLLKAAAKSYPIQLADEIILLHGHCEEIKEPILIIGYSKLPQLMPGVNPPPRIIFGLLNPKDYSSEKHLKFLAKFARLFHDKEIVVKILLSSNADEIKGILKENLSLPD